MFSNIIGQSAIKSRLGVSINARPETMLAQPIFCAEKGAGKTEIAMAYKEAIAQKLEVEPLVFHSPKEFRNVESDAWAKIQNWFLNQESGVLVIDECHHFNEKTTVQMDKVLSFMLKALDGQNTGKLLPFDADNFATFDKSKKVIIMLTNYPERINPALKSRMDLCTLAPYTESEMEQLTILQLAKFELVAESEFVTKLLAKSARGTGRPLYELAKHISRMHHEGIVTKDIAIETMRQMDMLPQGLNAGEVQLLQHVEDKKVLSAKIAGMLVTSLQTNMANTLSYMAGVCGLINLNPNGTFTLSPKGKSYLKTISGLGFIQ